MQSGLLSVAQGPKNMEQALSQRPFYRVSQGTHKETFMLGVVRGPAHQRYDLIECRGIPRWRYEHNPRALDIFPQAAAYQLMDERLVQPNCQVLGPIGL